MRAVEDTPFGERRYRGVIAAMDQGYCLIEMLFEDGQAVDYRFLETNPAFEQQTGMVNAVGKTMREMVPTHEAHWFALYGGVARTGKSIRFINEAQGLGRWFDVYASQLDEHRPNEVALLFTDITAKKEAEDELKRLATDLSRADRQRNEFLATLSHELRNPLAPLLSGVQLMQKAADRPGLVAKTRDMMERQLQHLVRLVDDLLDVARITSGKIELAPVTADIDVIVRIAIETALPQLQARDHMFSMSVPDEPVIVQADITRMAQVLSNLLGNASRYTPPGGQIALAVRREASDVVISVSDSGVGMEAESLTEVFEIFKQLERNHETPHEGLGIGLSLVRRLVDLHGGTVHAASPGKGLGSTFTVRLPLISGGRVADAA